MGVKRGAVFYNALMFLFKNKLYSDIQRLKMHIGKNASFYFILSLKLCPCMYTLPCLLGYFIVNTPLFVDRVWYVCKML